MTVPFPLPVAPVLSAIHASLLRACQAQPVAADTVTVPVPPPAAALADAGEIVGVHGAPAWVSVNVLPPIVIVPVRGVVVVFAAAVYETEPLPVPLDPALMVIHESVSVAVQSQPPAAVTATVPVPPEEATLAAAGAIVGAQGCAGLGDGEGARLPPTVSVPVRGAVVVLAATVI